MSPSWNDWEMFAFCLILIMTNTQHLCSTNLHQLRGNSNMCMAVICDEKRQQSSRSLTSSLPSSSWLRQFQAAPASRLASSIVQDWMHLKSTTTTSILSYLILRTSFLRHSKCNALNVLILTWMLIELSFIAQNKYWILGM